MTGLLTSGMVQAALSKNLFAYGIDEYGSNPDESFSSIVNKWLLDHVFRGAPDTFFEILIALIAMTIACLAVFAFVNVWGLFAIWAERKVSAYMQCRVGPMEVGPVGALQTIADGIKLMVKEDIIPAKADKILFIIAPVIVFAGTFLRFAPLPFGEKLVATDLNLGLFFIAAVGSIEVLGVIMAGWSSNNKWSLFATIRTATQMVSYEIPIGIAFVTVAVSAGTLSMVGIVGEQDGWFWNWFVFRNPFLMTLALIYIISSLAECKRAPFDLPEAESELVSGFHTEYTGMRFAMFFLAEYAAMYLVSAVAVVIFFGGWLTGIPFIDDIGRATVDQVAGQVAGHAADHGAGHAVEHAGPGWFLTILGLLIKANVLIGKSLGIVFIQMWVRWTLPRVRLDQMMHLCWKVLLPIALVCLLGSAAWDNIVGKFYENGEYALFFLPKW